MQQEQVMIIPQATSTRYSTFGPEEPPTPADTKPVLPGGNIIVAIPHTDAGKIALAHLSEKSEVDLGCSYLGTLADNLKDYGVENATYADELKYLFVLLRSAIGDEVSAINRLLRFHCAHEEPVWPHGQIEAAETNATLSLYAKNFGTIGLPFDLRSSRSAHNSYLQILKVGDAHQKNVMGTKVKVAVVDSGNDRHVTFVNQFSDIYDSSNTTPLDNVGHGTAMASIINDVAPRADVISIRIADTKPSLMATMAGVCKALYDFGADIINLSLGFSSLNSICGVCGKSADARSLVFEKFLWSQTNLDPKTPFKAPIYVTATGNDGGNSFNHPAAYDSTVAVGSINQHLSRSSFSNFGTQHSHFLVMPGGDYDEVNQSYTEWAGEGPDGKCLGTSTAAAYASGMLALYRSDPRYRLQSRPAFLHTIINNCRPLPAHNTPEHGAGYLQFI